MMNATATTMTAAPITIDAVIGSARISAPSTTATTGFTNAYVETSDTDALCRSHVYALYATSEPSTTRYANALSDRTENVEGSTFASSPRGRATTSSTTPPTSIWYVVETRALRGV